MTTALERDTCSLFLSTHRVRDMLSDALKANLIRATYTSEHTRCPRLARGVERLLTSQYVYMNILQRDAARDMGWSAWVGDTLAAQVIMHLRAQHQQSVVL